MPRICLSYRRSDSAAIVGRIYDRLLTRYGAQSVFMDVADIPYGADFRERILDAWQGAGILIAVIGPEWLGPQADGPARLHHKRDPVRVEIETALRQSMLVIPVLVGGAKMPSASDLPRSIQKIAYRNGMPVDSSLDFEIHIERLVKAVDQALGIEAADLSAKQQHEGLNAQPASTPTDAPRSTRQLAKSPQQLLPYFLAPTVLLLIAHYVIVISLNSDTLYLRPFAVLVPLACGALLRKNLHVGFAVASFVGLGIALASVAGMMTVVGLVDGHSILPNTIAGWQEGFEFVATITLATAAGSLLARAVASTIPRRWRPF
jgi:hypothetical protein